VPQVSLSCHCAQDLAVVAGVPAALHERVADDHIFFWKALVAEPCYWDSKVSAL
jgi:hypothetical protein